jgi:hypothetical protein
MKKRKKFVIREKKVKFYNFIDKNKFKNTSLKIEKTEIVFFLLNENIFN